MQHKIKSFKTQVIRSSLNQNQNTSLTIPKLLCFLMIWFYLDNIENIQNFTFTFYTPKVYVVPCGETIALSLECEYENCNILNIGTLSFINANTGNFASVGHAISHSHTPFSISQRSKIYFPTQLLITKDDDDFNTIIAKINPKSISGTTYINSNFGIYGKISEEYMAKYSSPPLEIASRYAIKCEPAILLSDILGDVEEFQIEILHYNIFQTNSYECMLIQITDERLLKHSGGIVRGMSGCPIIQNNKIIGVLSSMLIKDTTKGYAIFADLMINNLY